MVLSAKPEQAKRCHGYCLHIWLSLPAEAEACCAWDLGLLLARPWLRSPAGALAGAPPAVQRDFFSGLQSQRCTQREGGMFGGDEQNSVTAVEKPFLSPV